MAVESDVQARNRVLTWVIAHPGCTVKDVAIAVFGGDGAVRTYGRQKAYRLLDVLLADGAIRRERGRLSFREPDTFFANPVEDSNATG